MLLTRARRYATGALGILAAVAVVLLVVTCTGGGEYSADDAGADGPLDAGAAVSPPDARSPWRDAGPRDAGHDSGPDAVYRDAGLAEVDWERYPGLPEGCIIDRAVDPAQIYVSRWEPCPEAELVCQRLVTDWAFRTWRPLTGQNGNSHTGEYGYWSMRLEYPGAGSGSDPDVMALATTRGAPLLAFKYERCVMGTATSEDTIAHFIFDHVGTPPRAWVYFGRPEEASSLDTPVTVIDVGATGVTAFQEPVVTTDQLIGTVASSFLYAVRRTGETRRIDGLRPTSAVQTPRLVGEHLLWTEFGARWSVIHEADDGTIEPFIELADADVRVFDSDGSRMVWVQSYPPGGGSSYTRHEIWTAPYVRRPTDITGARRVLTVTDHRFPLGGGRLRGDRYAFVRRPEGAQSSLDLVDLDSGELRRFVLVPYYEEINPWVVYMSDVEVMIHGGAAGMRAIPMRIELARMPVVTP